GMADDDGRSGQVTNYSVVVVGDLRDIESGDRRGVAVEFFDFGFHARPTGSQDFVAATFVTRGPILPTARSQPQPVNEEDGVGAGRFRGVDGAGCHDVLLICYSPAEWGDFTQFVRP